VLIALTDRSPTLAEVVADVPTGARIRLATLQVSRTDAAEAACTAWDLPGLAERFRGHLAAMERPAEGPGAFRTFVDVLQPALTDTLREPALEPDLMPPGWPGPALREAMARYQAEHQDLTDTYLRDVLGAG
jgi:phenylacetic acid degradation operon negative regulatory protein